MYVACTNQEGGPDFFLCQVSVIDGEPSIKEAEELAGINGYAPPYLVFTKNEHGNIARVVTSLSCPVPFQLIDGSDIHSQPLGGHLAFEATGVCVSLDGHSDCYSDDDKGVVAFVEFYEAEAIVRVYGDINSG